MEEKSLKESKYVPKMSASTAKNVKVGFSLYYELLFEHFFSQNFLFLK
jgi:hypothetical protein